MISNFEFVSLEAESVLNPAITHPMCVYGGGCGGGNGRDAVVCPAGDSSKVGEVTCFLLVSVKRLIIIIFISVVLDTGCSWGRLVRCLFPLPPFSCFLETTHFRTFPTLLHDISIWTTHKADHTTHYRLTVDWTPVSSLWTSRLNIYFLMTTRVVRFIQSLVGRDKDKCIL